MKKLKQGKFRIPRTSVGFSLQPALFLLAFACRSWNCRRKCLEFHDCFTWWPHPLLPQPRQSQPEVKVRLASWKRCVEAKQHPWLSQFLCSIRETITELRSRPAGLQEMDCLPKSRTNSPEIPEAHTGANSY